MKTVRSRWIQTRSTLSPVFERRCGRDSANRQVRPALSALAVALFGRAAAGEHIRAEVPVDSTLSYVRVER